MTVVWPLPCHLANVYLHSSLLIYVGGTHFAFIFFHTDLLVESRDQTNKYVKDLSGIITADDLDPATLPMASSNSLPSCSSTDRAADGAHSTSCCKNASTDHTLFLQSSSHLPDDTRTEACQEEQEGETATTVNLQLPNLCSGKVESPRAKESGHLNVDAHTNATDYSMDSKDGPHQNSPLALGNTASERNSSLPVLNADFYEQSGLVEGLWAWGTGSEDQRPFLDVRKSANYSRTNNTERPSDTSSSGNATHDSRVSLRAWLSNSARVIDKVENLHIFKQIAEFVELAHCQGVVLRNVRPSSFLLSSMNRVSIIDSASSGTSSASSGESLGREAVIGSADCKLSGPSISRATERDSASAAQQMDYEMQKDLDVTIPVSEWGDPESDTESLVLRCEGADDVRQGYQFGKDDHVAALQGDASFTSSSSEHAGCQLNDEKFPLKEILSLELMCYRSPEEGNGGTSDFPSDVYSLGVLFLELFYSSPSQGEWSRAMSDLRHRLLPPSFLLDYPKEAAFCLLLLHPNPDCRPKIREIFQADVFNDIEDKLVEREAVMNLEEKLLEAETTLDFLLQMQQRKHVGSQKLLKELSSLDEDIKKVERWQALFLNDRRQTASFSNNSGGGFGQNSKPDIGFFKLMNGQYITYEEVLASGGGGLSHRRQELLLAKSSQLMRSFTNLREAYFSAIKGEHQSGSSRQRDSGQRSHTEKMGMPSTSNTFRGSKAELSDREGHIGCFFDDFCKFLKYSKFEVKATLQYGDILNTKNMVCSVNFDYDDEFFATAGVSKRIKIFDCNALLEEPSDIHYPVIEMSSKAKLSCVCWNKFQKNYLASSDLGGAVQLWDATTHRKIMEYNEHGKCVWSVDFSYIDSSRLASGSDDCCVKLWSTNQSASVGTIKTKANICSVQFSADHSHILAFGSADGQVYFHDLRYIRIPVCILTGHRKAVSFIRFAGPTGIVSASTDNTLKLWDLTRTNANDRAYGPSLRSRSDCLTTYTGHTNVKNFVGLSVAKENYIACGSETNEVFVYHKSLPVTMLSHKFKNADPMSGRELEDIGDQFVSSVCWRSKSQILVTANSVGNIQVLEMV